MRLNMKYIQQLKNNKHLVIAFGVLMIVMALNAQTASKLEPIADRVEIDTIIPKGYVLVPLNLENKEAISSVIQNFGLIDLYTGNPESGKSKKIANRIKIIRAPYNPNLFAVLVKDDLSERIMNESGLFYAVIQNKSELEGNNEINAERTKKQIHIEYQN